MIIIIVPIRGKHCVYSDIIVDIKNIQNKIRLKAYNSTSINTSQC